MCARACVRHSCTLLQHGVMLSQLPRDSNSNYSKLPLGVEKLEARLPFSRIPQMPYRAKSMCCLPSMMFAFLIDALWSLRSSLRAYPDVRRDRSRLLRATSQSYHVVCRVGRKEVSCATGGAMLWLAALRVSVCARVQLRASLVSLGAGAAETTPTWLDRPRTLTNHGACTDHTRYLLHARAK